MTQFEMTYEERTTVICALAIASEDDELRGLKFRRFAEKFPERGTLSSELAVECMERAYLRQRLVDRLQDAPFRLQPETAATVDPYDDDLYGDEEHVCRCGQHATAVDVRGNFYCDEHAPKVVADAIRSTMAAAISGGARV